MADRKNHEKTLVREIAGRIGAIKKEKGISQEDFTKIVTQQRFSSWNTKGAEPGVLKIYEIAKLLNVSMDFLITGEEELGLSHIEQELLDGFHQLDERDQHEVMDIVHLKIENAKKSAISSNWENA